MLISPVQQSIPVDSESLGCFGGWIEQLADAVNKHGWGNVVQDPQVQTMYPAKLSSRKSRLCPYIAGDRREADHNDAKEAIAKRISELVQLAFELYGVILIAVRVLCVSLRFRSCPLLHPPRMSVNVQKRTDRRRMGSRNDT